jgi:UDP-N-acetylmuramoylalanine--D-glutamate ligase
MMNKSNTLIGRRVLVVGLGISGVSAARFLLKRGAAVTCVDENEQLAECDANVKSLLQEGVRLIDGKAFSDIRQFDFVVVSPGIPRTQQHYRAALMNRIEVVGEMELACREIKTRTLGITGTNGKTTVTLLIAHILNSVGKKAITLGNIGIPLTMALDDPEIGAADIFVVELSSFQLETLQTSFLDHGVILNITPDHLDRYDSMQDYASAKMKLVSLIKPHGKVFLESKCAEEFLSLANRQESVCLYGYANESPSRPGVYSDLSKIYHQNNELMSLPLQYQGKKSHDLENIMAAYALCVEMGVTSNDFLTALQSFTKPSHRIEFVRTLSGISYYNDSKGTNIDAVIRAVESIEGPIILIAGGVDKGAPYAPWISAFGNKVKCIYAIGEAAKKIQESVRCHITVELCPSLEGAILQASKMAVKGDTVLLSPGCSSYDMFKDYTQRGNEFKRIVNAL